MAPKMLQPGLKSGFEYTKSGAMKQQTILIVDDDVDVRNVMVAALARTDYTVLAAKSAVAALNISNTLEGVIDLLVADYRTTGHELEEKMSQSRSDLKVLHISGYPLTRIREAEKTISGTDFLAKPFSQEQLVGKIEEILSNAQQPIAALPGLQDSGWKYGERL